jgi:hypothetical protein
VVASSFRQDRDCRGGLAWARAEEIFATAFQQFADEFSPPGKTVGGNKADSFDAAGMPFELHCDQHQDLDQAAGTKGLLLVGHVEQLDGVEQVVGDRT